MNTDKRIQVRFQNPITRKPEYVGSCFKIEEKKTMYSEYEFKFYSKHTYLLPKFITIQEDRLTYLFKIEFNGRFFHIDTDKTLKGIIKKKMKFITHIL